LIKISLIIIFSNREEKKRYIEMETVEADSSSPWLQPARSGGRN
jgi:hypothetical protein